MCSNQITSLYSPYGNRSSRLSQTFDISILICVAFIFIKKIFHFHGGRIVSSDYIQKEFSISKGLMPLQMNSKKEARYDFFQCLFVLWRDFRQNSRWNKDFGRLVLNMIEFSTESYQTVLEIQCDSVLHLFYCEKQPIRSSSVFLEQNSEVICFFFLAWVFACFTLLQIINIFSEYDC